MYDVAIIGAGPAGSVAARLLAKWQHRVVLIHRPVLEPPLIAESIPPSCAKLFNACGVEQAIEGLEFCRSTGNTVWWRGDGPRREYFAQGSFGYQVDRRRFDLGLRAQAVSAGAELRNALVRNVHLEGVGACVDVSGTEVRARFVLDCSGRAGVVARRGWRTDLATHPRTIAVGAEWISEDEYHGVDPTHTVIESYEDGWAWSVPLSETRRYVAVMVDPQRTNLARGAPATDVYLAEVRKAVHLSAMLREYELRGRPTGFDASVYTAHTYADDPLLLVGDAASFVDPLSSYGVKKALASAWLAAVAVHTSLRTPAMTRTALEFFAARERAMAASLLRQSREQLGDAAAQHAGAFWADRVTGLDLPSSEEPDVRALREDGRVRQAFEWLKAQPAIALRAGADVQRKPHAVIRGHEIVMEERLVTPICPDGLRFLRDVDLVGVLTLTGDHDQVPLLFESYNRRFPPVALPDFLGALSVMIAFGVLEDAGPSGVAGVP